VYLMRNYGRGAAGAFRLGRGHGVDSRGCGWARVLVMFAVGVANLWWMAALTAVMAYEKTGAGGNRAVPVTGIALLALAALVFAHPAWLPEALAGPR
jgi:predicted metal-binding membrane protein